jgi:hypothetical protein
LDVGGTAAGVTSAGRADRSSPFRANCASLRSRDR